LVCNLCSSICNLCPSVCICHVQPVTVTCLGLLQISEEPGAGHTFAVLIKASYANDITHIAHSFVEDLFEDAHKVAQLKESGKWTDADCMAYKRVVKTTIDTCDRLDSATSNEKHRVRPHV